MAGFIVPTIETDRLLLRQATSDDLDVWAKTIFADPDVTRYLSKKSMTPRERAEYVLDCYKKLWEQHPYGGWVVTDKMTHEFMGTCDLDSEETGEVEAGGMLAKAYWKNGYASEVAVALLRYGFQVVGLDRIVAVHVPENIASQKIAEKIGFVFEKKAHFYGLDVFFYGITPNQFKAPESFFRVHSADIKG